MNTNIYHISLLEHLTRTIRYLPRHINYNLSYTGILKHFAILTYKKQTVQPGLSQPATTSSIHAQDTTGTR